MNKQGWILTGQDADLKIFETRVSDKEYSYKNLATYADAKAEAIKQLQDHIEPYLKRLEELQNDAFADSGKLPPFKAWCKRNGRIVVAAKTKKRAMEFAHLSRNDMENYWQKCSGSWWYHLAYEEGVWCEEIGENRSGTGVFYRPIAREEADEIAVRHLNKYQTMPIDKLINIVGQEEVENGESSMGTPYRFTASISMSDWETEEICVIGVVDDCLNWTRGWVSINRKLPLHKAVVDWLKEGF
jgi:hypothetical protein